MTDAKQQKKALRRTLLQQRHALLSGTEGEALQETLRAALLRSELWRTADTVLLTASTAEELDTMPLCRAALREGKRLYLPRCAAGEMAFFALKDTEELAPGAFGIKEPPPTDPLPPEEAAGALCLIPALACDRAGHRIGYGGGYYDRWLARHTPQLLCLLPQALVPEQLPFEPHDISIPLLLTERGFVYTACPAP